MNDKEPWKIGEAKIYSEKFLANPLVVGSYQGISEIYLFINNLQAENKKLREALEKIVDRYFDFPYEIRMHKGLREGKESLIAREALKEGEE